jgi:hypothetical protein
VTAVVTGSRFRSGNLQRDPGDAITTWLSCASPPESRSEDKSKEKIMKLIRACVLVLTVMLPTSWTIAHAGDEAKEGDKSGEAKTGKGKSKKSKKKEGGDMGDMKKDDMK